jgi:hypothetical protein
LILGGERTASSGSAAVADFDGDGDLDVCSANADSTLAIYFQTSAGEFSPEPAVIREASLTDGVARLIAADLDGDADFDLCWCSSAGNSLTILFQTSPGVFSSEPVTLGDSSTTPEPHDVTAADLDGDGDLDLCSANWGGTTLSVFFQISPGVFSEIPRIVGNAPFPLSQQRPQSVAAADVDGDGDLDLCAASNWDSKLAVYTQTSPGVFSNVPRVLGIGLSTPGAMQVLAVDLDGDGDSDLASANVNGSLSIFWNTH